MARKFKWASELGQPSPAPADKENIAMQPNLFDDIDEPPPTAPDRLTQAIAAGESAAAACEEKAARLGWDAAGAGEFIVNWLRKHGPTAGETLVNEASKVYSPHDGRAFGPVFMRLSRAKRIESCGIARRAKGHGSPGLVWRLVTPRA